jgi:hypothetical protein
LPCCLTQFLGSSTVRMQILGPRRPGAKTQRAGSHHYPHPSSLSVFFPLCNQTQPSCSANLFTFCLHSTHLWSVYTTLGAQNVKMVISAFKEQNYLHSV